MKKLVATLLIGTLAWPVLLSSAEARMPYKDLFIDHYKGNEAVVKLASEAKCTICHDPMAKKIRNDYGKAINKTLTKADFDMLKANEVALKTKVVAALQAAEGEKNKDGKSFGEIIKSGKLPAEK